MSKPIDQEREAFPFCACAMRIESNRDWHRFFGEHEENCVFTDSETMMVPASDDQLSLLAEDWNRRVHPAGEYWPDQGGIYAGFMAARNGAEGYHLILGDELPGRFEWGPYDDLTEATSLTDGLANTQALVTAGDQYPAAKAASSHTADGHADFYLPAAAELYEIWLNLNGKLSGLVWSSSQRSADTAFYMYFDDGIQTSNGKRGELRVRPVRRFFINSTLGRISAFLVLSKKEQHMNAVQQAATFPVIGSPTAAVSSPASPAIRKPASATSSTERQNHEA